MGADFSRKIDPCGPKHRRQVRVNPWLQAKLAMQDQIEREQTSGDAIVPSDQTEIRVVNDKDEENQ